MLCNIELAYVIVCWLVVDLLYVLDLWLAGWLLHFNMEEEKLKRSSAAAINYSSYNLEFS